MSPPRRATPLQKLLAERGITSVRVEAKLQERLGGRAPDRRQMRRWRLGENEPRRKQMVWVLWAVRELAGDPSLQIDQLFDFEPANPDNWRV